MLQEAQIRTEISSENFAGPKLQNQLYSGTKNVISICFFCLQVQDDLQNGVIGAVPIPSDDAEKEEVISALVANVEGMIKADRKITSLKQLQVRKTNI